jgi:hypothetical protein
MLFFLSSPSYLQQSKLSHKNVVYLLLIYPGKRRIYNICMAKDKLPQVKGKIYHIFMAKIRVPQVRGGYRYTTFVWLRINCHR